MSHGQTRPLVNTDDAAGAQAEDEARLLAASRAWVFEPSVGATLTATNNSGLSFSSDKAKDLILDIEPRLIVRGRGASFTLDGNVGGRGLVYLNSTQENRLLPSGALALHANVIERWLYFDASALAEQIASNPYTIRADSASSLNKINSLETRFSPYVRHSFTPSLSLTLRNENVWTNRRGEFNANDPRRNSVLKRDTLLLEQTPQPLGFSIEGLQQTIEYRTGQKTVLQLTSARGVVSYAVDPTFILGLVGGKEKSEYTLSQSTDTISGLRVSWAPTERTQIRGTYEKRFFGNGGSLQFTHRSPFIAFSLNASREPSALGTSFVLNPAQGDVQTLLDAIFTTRYPNPAERAVVVGNVLAGLGTPSALGSPVEVFANYAQLRDSVIASAVFQGVRSTVVTNVFAVRSRQLSQDNAPLVPILGFQADNFQKGLSVDFNRRLTPTLSLDVGLGYASVEGLGAAEGQATENSSVRLGLTQRLTPRTRATLGARYLVSDIEGFGPEASAKELAVFIGLHHRF